MAKNNNININISPNYNEDKIENPSIDDLIDIFEDRTKNWLIDPAKILLNKKMAKYLLFVFC